MPAKRINFRLVKLHRSYSVDEVARSLGVHKNTVRGWIKQGLPAFASQRPVLVLGSELRAFLDGRRRQARCACPPGTIYCFKCRAPSRPALDMVDYIPHSPTGGNLKALCAQCGTMMHRRIALAAIDRKMPGIEIQIAGPEPRLTGFVPAPVNCDVREDR